MELIKDDSKFAEYKVNIQNSIALLYVINEQLQFEVKNHKLRYKSNKV